MALEELRRRNPIDEAGLDRVHMSNVHGGCRVALRCGAIAA
jgi:hypothetical protein